MLESLPLSFASGAGGKKWYAGMWGKEGFEMVLWDFGLSVRSCGDAREACFKKNWVMNGTDSRNRTRAMDKEQNARKKIIKILKCTEKRREGGNEIELPGEFERG